MNILHRTTSKIHHYASSRIFLKHFFIYSCSSLFLRCISFIIIPLNMRILTPSDYGIISLITSFTIITSAIMGLGLRQFLSIEYFHHDAHGKAHLIAEILHIYTFFTLPLLILLFLGKSLIISYVFFNALSAGLYYLIVISIFLSFYVELLYQILQYQQQAKTLIRMQIAAAGITTSITLLLLWVFHYGVASFVYAQLFSHIFLCIIAQKYFRTEFEISDLKKKAQKYIHQGLPFIPGILCNWMLASSDRWVLGYYTSMHEVGIYSVADLFAQLFYSLVLVPWASSYLPYIMNRYKDSQNIESVEQENSTLMWITMAGLATSISLLFLLGKPLLYIILPAAYYQALNYVWLLLMGQIFLLGTYFNSTLLQFKKHTYFLAFALMIPGLLNIGLNIVLIPSYGISGCSFATLVSYGIYFALVSWYKKFILKKELHEKIISSVRNNHSECV